MRLLPLLHIVINGLSSGFSFSFISCPKQAHSRHDLATALINYHTSAEPKPIRSDLDEFFCEPYPDTIPKDTTLNGSFF